MNEKFVSCLGLVAGFLAVIILGTILNGWVLSVLWEWFIVPVFELPKLSLGQSIGIAMVVSFLTNRYQPADKNRSTEDKLTDFIGVTLVSPLLALVLGWIVLQFVM